MHVRICMYAITLFYSFQSSPETSPSNITADECTSGSSLHEQYDYEYYVPNLEVNEKTEPLRCHTNTVSLIS